MVFKRGKYKLQSRLIFKQALREGTVTDAFSSRGAQLSVGRDSRPTGVSCIMVATSLDVNNRITDKGGKRHESA